MSYSASTKKTQKWPIVNSGVIAYDLTLKMMVGGGDCPFYGRTPKNVSKNNNFDDLSEQLLDITTADLFHHQKKPSLVVMGLWKQTTSMRYHSAWSIFFPSHGKCHHCIFWMWWRVGFNWCFMPYELWQGACFCSCYQFCTHLNLKSDFNTENSAIICMTNYSHLQQCVWHDLPYW